MEGSTRTPQQPSRPQGSPSRKRASEPTPKLEAHRPPAQGAETKEPAAGTTNCTHSSASSRTRCYGLRALLLAGHGIIML
eukprot:5079616-Alexandrium_andersonii.AAC.1